MLQHNVKMCHPNEFIVAHAVRQNWPRHMIGFTLLETLVALALLGLLAVMFSQGLQQGQRVFASTTRAHDDKRKVIEARETLTRWLSMAQPYNPDRSGVTTINPISGDGADLTFSASIDPTPGQDDLYRIRLWYDAASSEVRMAFQPDRNDLDSPSNANPLTLLNEVAGVQFEYLDIDMAGSGPTWVTDWQARPDLPEAIKVSMTFANSTSWPHLIVPLVITGREFCAFDPVSRRCR